MIDQKLEKEIEFIKKSLNDGKQLNFVKAGDVNSKKVKKSVRFRDSLSQRNALQFDDDDDSEAEKEELENGSNITDVNGEDSSVVKRAINYQIEKNKGLTPKRDKSYRNPRVRNRLKSRKALIKRKSIVRNVRTQDKRYSGEATGIRSTVVRAVKIK
jgi:U3 small nucleolar RNA-associated protein 3